MKYNAAKTLSIFFLPQEAGVLGKKRRKGTA